MLDQPISTRRMSGKALVCCHPCCYPAAVVAFEWNFEDFQRLRLDDEVEILMDRQAKRALVLWPWYKNGEPEVDKAMWHAQAQGFEMISEVGNIIGYRIPEVDNEDWEFILMEPQ